MRFPALRILRFMPLKIMRLLINLAKKYTGENARIFRIF